MGIIERERESMKEREAKRRENKSILCSTNRSINKRPPLNKWKACDQKKKNEREREREIERDIERESERYANITRDT